MPKSKNKKNQKKRAANYSNQVKSARKKVQQHMMQEFQKKQFEKLAAAAEHETGEVVENDEIAVDVELDDIDVELDDIELEENTKEEPKE